LKSHELNRQKID